jgi:hypothetical protein
VLWNVVVILPGSDEQGSIFYDVTVQGVYNETPWFYLAGCLQWHAAILEIFENRQMFFSGVNGLLRTTGVQISAQILGYLTGHSWGVQAMLT